ncbi:NAD(P)-dependent dehydrogenase (short-subunit alcohol dehydrogenase family) [Rhizobium leguminosarum]
MPSLNDKTAIITGALGAIGKALVNASPKRALSPT